MIAVRPRADQVAHPGERLAVSRDEPDDLIVISQERTLPERVARPDAHRVTRDEVIALTEDDARWLHSVLGESLGVDDRIARLEAALRCTIAALRAHDPASPTAAEHERVLST